jgi:8-oxo-dGTP pyrophosphatase MutT (NUDIX family)
VLPLDALAAGPGGPRRELEEQAGVRLEARAPVALVRVLSLSSFLFLFFLFFFFVFQLFFFSPT